MFIMLYFILIIILLLIIMMILNFTFSKKIFKIREKMSPFEGGFDPMSNNPMPCSLQFYLISIIFLIFDVEITMILPMIEMNYYLFSFTNLNSTLVLLILLYGLYLEWIEGAWKWFK